MIVTTLTLTANNNPIKQGYVIYHQWGFQIPEICWDYTRCTPLNPETEEKIIRGLNIVLFNHQQLGHIEHMQIDITKLLGEENGKDDTAADTDYEDVRKVGALEEGELDNISV